MLLSLHVKNLAIIDEEEIEFGRGLNILSGETGAGKSIILGALGLAMGQKPIKGVIRDEDKEALAEAVFSVDERQKALIAEIDPDLDLSENEVILSRRITPGRAVAKINGETVPAGKLNEIADSLIDIYGQHEQQTLLSKKNHILLLDDYAGEEISVLKEKISESYKRYKRLSEELSEASMEESDRVRETDLLRHEISEIESANLSEGEDADLFEEYKKLTKSEKVLEAVNSALQASSGSVTEGLGRAIRDLISVSETDEEVKGFVESLSDAENILNETFHGLSSYADSLELSPQRLSEVAERIDRIDLLKRKYSKSGTIKEIFETLEKNRENLEKLVNFDEYLERLKSDLKTEEEALSALCAQATEVRRKYAFKLISLANDALHDLNIEGSGLDIRITPSENYTATGKDIVELYISTNPGEPFRPLNDIASGGELSRIMLAIKTIFAGDARIDTLVFDEIDSGVSGRTAAKVAGRLSSLSGDCQVICITHLPQIAARANKHFLIEKKSTEASTVSGVRELSPEERINEVARMLAGDDITEAALENAKDLIKGNNGQ